MVESAEYDSGDPNENDYDAKRKEFEKSDLFVPILKEMANLERNEWTFYLAYVEAFKGLVVVVPDVGGPKTGIL